ncbi:MAG: CBS domain-containing protein [Bdellovibrionales bacterium]|nr:CBS domain-containing protein [Bdellovibrionales bacterium]
MNIQKYMTELPHTIGHDISVSKAKNMMHEVGCHHLPVLDGGHLVGVISSRDLNLIESIRGGGETPVEEIMTEEPIVVDPDMDVKEAIKVMMEKRIGSLIIRAKEGRPWGIFTYTDALKVLS